MPHSENAKAELLDSRTSQTTLCSGSDCRVIVYAPFGLVPSCMSDSLAELSTTLSIIESLAPGCFSGLFQSCAFSDWEGHMSIIFKHPSSVLTDANYNAYSSHLTTIDLCLNHLKASNALRCQISFCLTHHQPNSATTVLKLLNNLNQLYKVLRSTRGGLQHRFWTTLDSDVHASAGKLHQIMAELSLNRSDKTVVKHVSWRHLFNLGVSRWLDDELINYFVHKWSYQTAVLGLNSFFSVKFLFETENCDTARDISEVVSEEGYQRNILKWAQTCQKEQNSERFNLLFIPINGGKRHWFSACIDYTRKRIDIYDSLQQVCTFNRSKPPNERQNAKLMLVLMWIASTVGQLRDESMDIDKFEEWNFDPHAVVPFQSNQHNCGMHMLWHLKHLIEYGQILGKDNSLGPLCFTSDMVGKRLRLVQELLEDST